MPGVLRTRVGYAGGPAAHHPTYHRIGGYTEAIEVDFDADALPLPRLLSAVFAAHNPHATSFSAQYQCAVWFRPDQEPAVRAAARAAEGSAGRIATRIEPFDGRFFLAERYHQKYRLQTSARLGRDFVRRHGLSTRDLLHSTSLARLNGFLGREWEGAAADLVRELDALHDLPPAAARAVRDCVAADS